ncbi:hypothetical protein KVR01_007395 [Diaporthe batatas]|uniref:uncharacterized protein n=1 Tax=Diaporthe batatas TaxID=748121 RepID=UPI001D03674C|nr:uncharacterized protein KVR01_007395 [Diaporthe batatas]KAG8162917.1 hypothetical protein KVR01_007395 [Diaporthe batatas]
MSRNNLLNSNTPVVQFARARMADRSDEIEKGQAVTKPKSATGKPERRDFLSRFIEARGKDPEFISQQRVLALTVANMFAGSDTTAITLRSIFHNLLTHPAAMEKLLAELAAEGAAGRLAKADYETDDRERGEYAETLVRWNDVRELPYLTAVIYEGLRCHPAAGLPLERIVPAAGLNIDGHHIPAGSIVGCSGWVIHRDEGVYGAKADDFRPERWIEATPEQLSKMRNCLLSFGQGSRTCAGRNVSLLEMYKLIPALLRMFEVRLWVDQPLPNLASYRKIKRTLPPFRPPLQADPYYLPGC